MRQVVDRIAGLWRPKPAPKFARHEYKAVWNSVSGTENGAKFAVSGATDESGFRESAQVALDVLQSTVGVKPDDVILEIGAGVGRVGAALAPLCREWIGVDVSENMVGHIRQRLRDYPNVRAIATSGFDLAPVESGSVDLVYCTVVFMHLDEWERHSYVLEAFRVLRPGGRFLVDNINLCSDEGWRLFEAHRAIPPGERPVQISKTSTPDELRAYFSRAGFVDIRQQEAGVWIRTFGSKPTPGAANGQG